MSKAEIILIFLVSASALQVLCLSFVIWAKRNPKRIDYIIGLIFFLYGIIFLSNTSYRQGTEYLTAHLLQVNSPLVFFLAPLLYIYFMILLHGDFQLKKKHLILFIPGAIVLFVHIPFYILDAPSKLALYPLTTSTFPLIHYLTKIFKKTGSIVIFISFLLTLRSTFFLWNKKALVHISMIRRLLLYIAGWVPLAGLFVLSDLTGNITLCRIAYLMGNIMLIFYFLLMYRDPDFFNKVRKESREIKYLNSRLRCIDRENVIAQLDSLIVKEEIYKESNLSLKMVSSKLNMSAPQFSELLNSHYDTSFNNFINSYRIREVKKILEKEPEANILQTAFDCGFNSKTAFNTAFRRFATMTPTEYRKKILSNHNP